MKYKTKSYVLVAKKKGATKAVLSKFACSDSKNTVFSNLDTRSKIVSPFGATSYLVSKKQIESSVLDSKDISVFKTVAKCDDCGTHWVASSDFKKDHKNFNCMICASELEVIESPEDMNELVQDIVEDEMYENAEEGVETINELEDMIEESETDEEYEITLEDETPEAVEAPAEESENQGLVDHDIVQSENEEVEPALEEETETPAEEVEEQTEESNTDMSAEMETCDAEETEDQTMAPESVEEMDLPEALEENKEESSDKFNLATLLNKAEYKDKLELVLSSLDVNNPAYYILVNRSPVATAEFASASEEVKSFFTDADMFAKAFIAALDGIEQTEANISLKNFGVKPIMAPIVSDKAAVAYNVNKIQKRLEASYKKKQEDMFATWQQCFSTAVVAACKGLKKTSDGKTKSLTVKAMLVDTLKSVGIQNANLLVEEAFKKGIQRDFGHIVEEALSLYQGTPEKREAWASMVSESNYQAEPAPISIQASKVENENSFADQKKSFKVESSALSESFNVFKSMLNSVRNGTF